MTNNGDDFDMKESFRGVLGFIDEVMTIDIFSSFQFPLKTGSYGFKSIQNIKNEK